LYTHEWEYVFFKSTIIWFRLLTDSNIHLLNNKSYGIYLLGTEHLTITEGLCFSFPKARKKLACKTKIKLVVVITWKISIFFQMLPKFFDEYCQIKLLIFSFFFFFLFVTGCRNIETCKYKCARLLGSLTCFSNYIHICPII
jgi:hypothetical protein